MISNTALSKDQRATLNKLAVADQMHLNDEAACDQTLRLLDWGGYRKGLTTTGQPSTHGNERCTLHGKNNIGHGGVGQYGA